MQRDGDNRVVDRNAWFEHEFEPVVEMLREADLIGNQTEAEAYARIVSLRYLLLRTHDWDSDVLDRLRTELRERAPRDEDTLTLRVPSDGGVRSLRSLMDRLDAQAIEVAGLTVHTPDLDDVFLALTGQTVPTQNQAQKEFVR